MIMRFNELIKEASINKNLINQLLNKWKPENQNLTSEEVERIVYEDYASIKNGLNPKTPAVYSFLSRFDGSHGNEAFNAQSLQDITKYSYKQITGLLEEYKDEDFEIQEDPAFSGKDLKMNEKRIEASRDLWTNPNNCIINKDGFRVYYINDQKESMKFGYYQNYCQKLFWASNQWCVTGTGESDSRSNLWATYRPARTFYFVIDESKLNGKTIEQVAQENPKLSKANNESYYLAALQVVTDDSRGYRLTYMLNNDGDTPMTWESLVKIYPGLDGEQNKFEFRKFKSEDELLGTGILNRITEHEGSPYEFRKQPRKIKKAYITTLRGNIHKVESWMAMDDGLRDLYILPIEENDIHEKFQTYELMMAIKKSGNIYKVLDNRLKQLGKDGVSVIFDKIFTNNYKVARMSLDNKNVRLYLDKNTRKYGLFNGFAADFLKFKGNVYTCEYVEYDTQLMVDEEGSNYIVEIYTKGGEPDQTSFYCIYPIESEGKFVNGHFFSHEAYTKMIERLKVTVKNDEVPDVSMIDKVNPDDIDIKEIKKGV